MAYSKKKIRDGLIIAFFIIFFGSIVLYSVRHNELLSGFPRYTIGTTYKESYTSTGVHLVRFKYYVSGSEYNGSERYRDCEVPGGRYYVKFSEKDPSISEMYQDKPVPSHIKEAPPEGWQSIPK